MSKVKRKKLHNYLKKQQKRREKQEEKLMEEGEYMTDKEYIEMEEGEEIMTDKEYEEMKQSEQPEMDYENYKGKKKNNTGRNIGIGICTLALLLGLKSCMDRRNNNNLENPGSSSNSSSSSSSSSVVVEKDTEAPILEVEYSTEELTSMDVEAIIRANEEIQPVDGWKLSESNMELSKIYKTNADEKVTVKDLAGNESVANVKITNIDKTKATPTVSYSTKELTNDSVTVTISSTKEMQPVSGWTLSKDKKSMTKVYTENTEEKVTVKDLVGNANIVDVKVKNIDKTFAPVAVTYSTKEMTNGNITVTITSTEEMQPVVGWTLSKDKKSMTKVFTENTEEKVTVKDLAGNTQTVIVKVSNIDRGFTAPTVTYSTKEMTNGNVTVTITSTEAIQAVEGWTLSEDKKSMTKVYTGNIEETITVKDLAGNSQTVNVKISNIDKDFALPIVTYSTKEMTNGDVVVTITSTEAMQPLEGWELSKDKKSMTKTYTTSKSEIVIVRDLVGNERTLYINVNNIDKDFAKATVSYTKKGGNVIVTITANEKLKPLKGWTLSKDEKSLTKTYSDNKTEKVTISDLVGNEQTVEIKVTGISYSSSDSSSYTPSGPSNPGTNPGTTDPGTNPGTDPGTNPGSSSDRENNNSDIKDNTGVGSGGTTGDDDDIELANITKEELQKLYVMKAELETIKIDGLEFEYPVRKLTI